MKIRLQLADKPCGCGCGRRIWLWEKRPEIDWERKLWQWINPSCERFAPNFTIPNCGKVNRR